MNAPNALALARALATLPITALVQVPEHTAALAALAVFGVAAATDALDGWLARRRGLATPLGAALDPLADKILVLGTLTALAIRGLVPPWALAAIAGRELAVTALRAAGVTSTSARGWGKVKVIVQDTAAAALLAALAFPALGEEARLLLVLAVAITLASFAEHLPVRRWARVA